jgi:uncharacterized protein YneF (UPF0154 family)
LSQYDRGNPYLTEDNILIMVYTTYIESSFVWFRFVSIVSRFISFLLCLVSFHFVSACFLSQYDRGNPYLTEDNILIMVYTTYIESSFVEQLELAMHQLSLALYELLGSFGIQ